MHREKRSRFERVANMMYLLITFEDGEIGTIQYQGIEEAKTALKEDFYAHCHRLGIPEEDIEENTYCVLGHDEMSAYIGSDSVGYSYASKIEAF